ncbi:MAG: hypothetical protein QF879_02295, partial [Candidatus Latescibacteria bacterium]|nr:hypothetical protein [Candidatus Latescibacterota bacterium]
HRKLIIKSGRNQFTMAAALCRSFNILAHGSSSILSPLQGRFSYCIVFAVIGMRTLGGGSSNTE